MKKGIFILWLLIILGFSAIEFPGIFLINRIEPAIFGLPFIYGFTLIVWGYLCVLLYIGYRMKWGASKSDDPNATSHKRSSRQ